jgi:predicted regulator of amino acid metabolism with ACT domain
MVRVIINYRNENVVKKIRNYGKVIYESDLLNVIGADVPKNRLDELKKIEGVEKISFPGKADIM